MYESGLPIFCIFHCTVEKIYTSEVGLSSPEFKPVENPPMDDRHASGLRSCGSAKQEKNVFYEFP